MQFTSIVAASVLAYAASAAPVSARDGPNQFTLMALRSGSKVHLSPIHASGLGLVIGKDTATYCPSVSGVDCSAYTSDTTAFAQGADSTTVSMDVRVPGGQLVYVDPNYPVKYSQAHSANIPIDAVREGFHYTAPAEGQSVGSLTLDNHGFYACPSTNGGYTVEAVPLTEDAPSAECIPFALGAVPYTGSPAWQYT